MRALSTALDDRAGSRCCGHLWQGKKAIRGNQEGCQRAGRAGTPMSLNLATPETIRLRRPVSCESDLRPDSRDFLMAFGRPPMPLGSLRPGSRNPASPGRRRRVLHVPVRSQDRSRTHVHKKTEPARVAGRTAGGDSRAGIRGSMGSGRDAERRWRPHHLSCSPRGMTFLRRVTYHDHSSPRASPRDIIWGEAVNGRGHAHDR